MPAYTRGCVLKKPPVYALFSKLQDRVRGGQGCLGRYAGLKLNPESPSMQALTSPRRNECRPWTTQRLPFPRTNISIQYTMEVGIDLPS